LTAISFAVIGLLLHWKFSVQAPPSKEEKKQEVRRFELLIAILFAAIFVAGVAMFIYVGFSQMPEWPPDSRWLIRVASFIIAGVCFLLSLVFVCVFAWS